MFPPIHQSTNGLPNERRGSGFGGGFYNDNNRKQAVAAGLSSPSRAGYPVNQSNGVLSTGGSASFSLGPDRMAERVQALERENDRFREEIQHLRQLYSSNQHQQHENDKLSVGKVAEDLQRLAHSFNSKLQADVNHQQREQQKTALLVAEVTRLGHRVEGLESELRGVVDDTARKFEAQEQHAQFMASVSSKQQQQAASPSRNAELQRQLRDMQDAMVQLRGEVDADRSARWKNDAVVDAKLDAQLERFNSKLTADKRDLARALDEQRQLLTGADFQRVTSHMREFSRLNDHLLALERWLHSEFGQIKRVFQALAGDVDARFQSVLVELDNGLKMWHAAQARQEDELGVRFQELEEAVSAVAIAVQRKLRTLEEVIPLEVQARQKNDDKLRRRVEGVVKALGHAIETSRGEYLPHQSELIQRVHQLELTQRNTSDEVNMQHNAMKETIQAFMEDSDAMLVRLAAVVELERIKGLATAREAASLEIPAHVRDELTAQTGRVREELSALQAWTTLHEQECHKFLQTTGAPTTTLEPMVTHTHEELNVETKRVKEEVNTLQAWTAMHAQECRQFFDFLNWSMDDARRESAVIQCLDGVIDQIVETQACGHFNKLAKGVNGALKQIAVARTAVSRTSSHALMSVASINNGGMKPGSARPTYYSLHLPEQGSSKSAKSSARSRGSEGATDLLELSTTTYYASTDEGAQMEQRTENEKHTEKQKVLQDENTLEESTQPCKAEQDTADPLPFDFEAPSEVNMLDPGVTSLEDSDAQQHRNDDAEEECSTDMTQDEEIKVEHATIAHSSHLVVQEEEPGDDYANSQDTDQTSQQVPAASTPPEGNKEPDDEEPLTLDL